MHCVNCSTKFSFNDKYCASCGTARSLSSTCVHCAATFTAEAKFCPNCGTPRTISDEFAPMKSSSTTGGEFLYLLFPRMRSPSPVDPEDYWISLIHATVTAGVAATVSGMLLIEITKNPSISTSTFSIIGMYVFLKIFGHKYSGRLIQSGLHDKLELKQATWILAAITFIGTLVAWWIAFLGWVGVAAITIYVGVAKSVLENPSEKNKQTRPSNDRDNDDPANAIADGVCPNCDASITLSAVSCPKCNTTISPGSDLRQSPRDA